MMLNVAPFEQICRGGGHKQGVICRQRKAIPWRVLSSFTPGLHIDFCLSQLFKRCELKRQKSEVRVEFEDGLPKGPFLTFSSPL